LDGFPTISHELSAGDCCSDEATGEAPLLWLLWPAAVRAYDPPPCDHTDAPTDDDGGEAAEVEAAPEALWLTLFVCHACACATTGSDTAGFAVVAAAGVSLPLAVSV
jgi:hypothetical protein